jgi:hypothetical protein
VDTAAPDLASAPVVTPQRPIREGGQLELKLVATEPLSQPPEVTLLFEQSHVSATCTAIEGSDVEYACAQNVTKEGNGGRGGAVYFDVRLVDLARNETVKRRAGSFLVDFEPPVAITPTLEPKVARLSSDIQLFFTTDGPLDGAAMVEVEPPLGGASGQKLGTFALVAEKDSQNYRLSHKVTEADPDALVTFTVSMKDLAGNETLRFPLGSLRIDRTLPKVADETLSGFPLAEVTHADGKTKRPFAHQSGTRNAFVYTVTPSDKDGEYTTQIQLTDAVGNVGPLLAGPKLALDASVPKVTKVVHRDRPSGKYRDGDTVTLTVDASDSDGVAPAVAATLGGKSMTCNPSAATAGTYTCTNKIDSLRTKDPHKETTQFILVRAEDGAGNVALSSAAAEFDFTPPTFTAGLNKASFKVGEVLFLTLTASEPLAKDPVVTADGSSTYLALRSGTRYIYEHTIAAGEPRNGRIVKVDLVDEAANETLGATDPKAKFTVDSSLPTIASLGTLGARRTYGGQPGFNEVKVTFTAGDPDDAAPPSVVAKIGGRNMTCTATPTVVANTSDYSCAYTVDPNRSPSPDTDGIKGVLVTATDAAGNESAASTSVTFDFKGPGVAAATVNYVPSPSNPLSAVNKATSGTKRTTPPGARPSCLAGSPTLYKWERSSSSRSRGSGTDRCGWTSCRRPRCQRRALIMQWHMIPIA